MGRRANSDRPPKRSIQAGPQRQNRLLVWAICGLLLAAVAIVFGQTLRHGFINYDDQEYVYENPHIYHGLQPKEIGWIFTHSLMANWHPLTSMSHMLDCTLFGLAHPGGHHAVNVALHAATAILLFLVLLRMTGGLWPAAFVAALFAVHPLRAESVAWVSERKDVLSGLFFMLTLWAYTGYVRKPFSLARYLAVAVLFALGLMAKPMVVTLPFVLLLLDYWPLGRFQALPAANAAAAKPGGVARRRVAVRLVVEKLPLLALVVAGCIATLLAQRAAIKEAEWVPLAARILNALVSYLSYLVQLFWPVGLAPYYPLPPEGAMAVLAGKALGAGVVLAAITAAVLAWRRAYPYLLVGWFWYLGMLVPVIGLVQVGGQSMADRYTYLPQIGLYLMIAWGVRDVSVSWTHRRWICGAAAAAVLAALTACGAWQVSYWRDSITLWKHAVDCTTPNATAFYNLADAEFERSKALKGEEKQEEIRAVIEHYKRSAELDPNDPDTHNNLAEALAYRGEVAEALEHYRRALQLNSSKVLPHKNLADLLADHGQVDEAIAQYEEALNIDSSYADAHDRLGVLLAGRGKVGEAIDHYRKAIDAAPKFPSPHLNLGSALAGAGQLDEAVKEYLLALKFDPHYAKAHNNLGTALARLGQGADALAHLREAVHIDPGFSEAHGNLAWVLAGRGQIDEAITHFRKALETNPRNATALKQWNLALDLHPGDVRLLNAMAWLLATAPEASLRDGAKAVELAGRAVRLSGGRQAALLDTLAAAYAETGRFNDAVQTADKARSLAVEHGDKALAEAIEKRLSLYRRRMPWRERWKAPSPQEVEKTPHGS